MTPFVEHVHCSRCGTRCSGVDPELGLVVRAWVECPECLKQSEGKSAKSEGNRCINCFRPFARDGVRYYFGANEVGPFCESCDQVIKTHTLFRARAR